MMADNSKGLDRMLVRRVSGETGACETTVLKRLRGERVRGVIGDKIDAALRAHGFEPVNAADATSGSEAK